MPELPEVETTVRAISPVITGLKLKNTVIRNRNLRWKITSGIDKLKDVKIKSVSRRAKYILLNTDQGSIMIHLGMSGRLSILDYGKTPGKHDHVDFIFNKNVVLRYTDPRRFGSVLLITENLEEHPLLSNLGPEPLSKEFTTKYLYDITRNRKAIIKQLIMNHKIVVGVGNIYANEALFLARLSPLRKSYTLTKSECQKLIHSIRTVLKQAIKKGGTTLRDFRSPGGNFGYFVQKLLVYGRENKPCVKCGNPIVVERKNQRSTFFCVKCQK